MSGIGVAIQRLAHAKDLPLPEAATPLSAGVDLMAAIDAAIECDDGAGKFGLAANTPVEDNVGARRPEVAIDIGKRTDANIGTGRVEAAARGHINIDQRAGGRHIAGDPAANHDTGANRPDRATGLRRNGYIGARRPDAALDRAANLNHSPGRFHSGVGAVDRHMGSEGADIAAATDNRDDGSDLLDRFPGLRRS